MRDPLVFDGEYRDYQKMFENWMWGVKNIIRRGRHNPFWWLCIQFWIYPSSLPRSNRIFIARFKFLSPFKSRFFSAMVRHGNVKKCLTPTFVVLLCDFFRTKSMLIDTIVQPFWYKTLKFESEMRLYNIIKSARKKIRADPNLIGLSHRIEKAWKNNGCRDRKTHSKWCFYRNIITRSNPQTPTHHGRF